MNEPVKRHIAWLGGIGRGIVTLAFWLIVGVIIGVGLALLMPGPRIHLPWVPWLP